MKHFPTRDVRYFATRHVPTPDIDDADEWAAWLDAQDEAEAWSSFVDDRVRALEPAEAHALMVVALARDEQAIEAAMLESELLAQAADHERVTREWALPDFAPVLLDHTYTVEELFSEADGCSGFIITRRPR